MAMPWNNITEPHVCDPFCNPGNCEFGLLEDDHPDDCMCAETCWDGPDDERFGI